MTRRPALRGVVDFVTARFEDAADQTTDGLVKLAPDAAMMASHICGAMQRIALQDVR